MPQEGRRPAPYQRQRLHNRNPQAKREIEGAREQVIALTPDEQLAFWNALNEPPVLTAAQRRLGAIMRGEA